jgi:hypothetical protein
MVEDLTLIQDFTELVLSVSVSLQYIYILRNICLSTNFRNSLYYTARFELGIPRAGLLAIFLLGGVSISI